MALTKVSRGLLSTGIVDNSNATAITIDSSENVGIGTTVINSTLSVGSTDSGATITSGGTNTHLQLKAMGSAGVLIFGAGGVSNGTAGTERMRLDASGALVLNNSGGDAQMYFGGTSGTNRMYLARSGNDSLLWNVSNGLMRFGVNNTEAFRITAARDMYFGQTTGSAASVGHIMQANGKLFNTADGGTVQYLRRLNSDGAIVEFNRDGTSVGSIGVVSSNDLSVNATDELNLQVGGATKALIASNGSLYLYAQATGAGNADLRYATGSGQVTYDTSSRLVKAEIEDIPYGLSTVMALSPKRYQRTDSDNKLEVGFIADEVVEVVPELVGMMEKRFLTMNQEDTEVVAGSVEYNKMTAVLVKAIQEQQATIEALTQRIETLENN